MKVFFAVADYEENQHLAEEILTLVREMETVLDEEENAWRRAESSGNIEQYYEYAKDYPTGKYVVQAEQKINQIDESAYYDAIKAGTQTSLNNYLYNHPRGKFREEVQQKLIVVREEDAWQTARDENQTAGYYRYLDKYPDGKYKSDALQIIEQYDVSAYNKALSEASQSAFNYYLNNYPRGRFRSEISEKLAIRKEEDAYSEARNSDDLRDYESYIRTYPNGRYAAQVNDVIEHKYFELGNEEFSNKEWDAAIRYYETYQDYYPSGQFIDAVTKKIKRAEGKQEIYGAGFVAYNYDSRSPVGISLGRLSNKVVGFNFSVKFHPDIFSGTDVLYEVDEDGNSPDSPWDIELTGNRVSGNVGAHVGLTFKLAYPVKQFGLWLSVGGGYIYQPTYLEVEEIGSGDIELYRSTEEKIHAVYPEGGIIMGLGGIVVLQYAVIWNTDIIHKAGFGFQF